MNQKRLHHGEERASTVGDFLFATFVIFGVYSS